MKKLIYTPDPIEEAILLEGETPERKLTAGVLITGQRMKGLKLLFPSTTRKEKLLEVPELKPILAVIGGFIASA